MSLGSWIVGRAASPIFMWIVVAASAAMIGIIGLHLWHDHTVKKERDAAIEAKGQLSERVDRLKDTINRNGIALQKCQATNEANTAEVGRLNTELDKAEARVTLIDDHADDTIEDINRDAEAIRGTDPTCRTLDDHLPDSFVASVRKPAAADSH